MSTAIDQIKKQAEMGRMELAKERRAHLETRSRLVQVETENASLRKSLNMVKTDLSDSLWSNETRLRLLRGQLEEENQKTMRRMEEEMRIVQEEYTRKMEEAMRRLEEELKEEKRKREEEKQKADFEMMKLRCQREKVKARMGIQLMETMEQNKEKEEEAQAMGIQLRCQVSKLKIRLAQTRERVGWQAREIVMLRERLEREEEVQEEEWHPPGF
uniref:Vicilin-like seed storage protein At2g18540 n=1 Tax=Caenorhabditis tropicalis TaxID=1561998 RepID=A0A1I7TPF1_9PELO